ncbi:MAG: sugar ABC transporter permease [Anaerolineales bacterium]|nr:sugar ABC transporter permease [Anaerolineales bacterium]
MELAATPESRSTQRWQRQKRLTPWLFVAPCLVVILLVTIFPTIYSFGLSLYKWELTLKDKPFVGLANYSQLFQDDRFLNSSLITLLLVVVGVSLEALLGFAFAQNLMAEMRGKRLIVALMLLPVMVMPVVVGYTWRLLWDAQYGPINQMIGWVIGQPFQFTWLGQTSTAILAILVTEIWQWTPFMFLIFFSGLATLDPELFDAADIDGASGWNKLWHITLPLMRPIIIVAVLIRSLDALKTFDTIYTLTGGAPGTSTETVSFYIYKTGFQFFRLGYGAAASFILLIVLAALLTYLLKVLRTALA